MITVSDLLKIVNFSDVSASILNLYDCETNNIKNHENNFMEMKQLSPQNTDKMLVEVAFMSEDNDDIVSYPVTGVHSDKSGGCFMVTGYDLTEEYPGASVYEIHDKTELKNKEDLSESVYSNLIGCDLQEWVGFYVCLDNLKYMSKEDFIAHCLVLINRGQDFEAEDADRESQF